MKCPNCNIENDKESVFCKKCGTRLSGMASGISTLDKKDDKNINKKSDSKTNSKFQKFVNKIKDILNPFSKAFDDVFKNNENIKRTLIAAFCNIIPVVNFASTGYAQSWGLASARKKEGNLLPGIFFGSNLKVGFFEFVTFLVYGVIIFIVLQIANFLFGQILLIALILELVFYIIKVFYHAYVSLACMKTAASENLGSSFELKNIWATYKKNIAQVFFLYFIPSLLCAIISTIVSMLIVSAFASGQADTINNFLSNFEQILLNVSSLMQFAKTIVSLIGIGTICYCANAFLTGIEKIIRYRALGYYIADYAPEWVE